MGRKISSGVLERKSDRNKWEEKFLQRIIESKSDRNKQEKELAKMKIRFYIKKRIIYRLVSMQLIGILIISLFTGCAKETSSLTTSGFAFNTTYTITVYQGGTQKTLDTVYSKCADYEQVFSLDFQKQ